MRKRILLAVLVVILGLTVTACGQAFNNFNFLGDGARARGMGGAFISIADDASALTWNPAGLIQLVDPQISFAFDFFGPKTSYDMSYSGTNSDMSFSNDYKDNKFFLQYAAFSAPVRIKDHPFVLSISFSTLAYEYDYNEFNPDSGFTSPAEPVELAERTNNRLNQLRMGFGSNVWKKLNFGAGLNIMFGKGYIDSTFIYTTTYTHEQGVLVERIARGYVFDTLSFSGVNIVGGFQWDGDRYNLGLVVKTPYFLTTKHVKFERDTVTDNGVVLEDYIRGDIEELPKEKVEIPWMVGVGASYNISEDLLVSADFEWRRFGAANFRIHNDTTLSNGDIEEHYTEHNLGYYNGFSVRAGVEYTLHPGFTTMPVRAGFRYEALGLRQLQDVSFDFINWDEVQPDSTVMNYTLGDQLHASTITFGLGMYWELIKLDFAFEYDILNQDIDGDDYYGAFNVSKEYKAPRLSLTFTGYFK